MQTIQITEAHYFLLVAGFAAVLGALVGRIIAEEAYDRPSAIFFRSAPSDRSFPADGLVGRRERARHSLGGG
jgi:hypothetical protein